MNCRYHVKEQPQHEFPAILSRTTNYMLQLITTCTRVQRRIGVSNSSRLSLQGRELRAMLTRKIVLMVGSPLLNRIFSPRSLIAHLAHRTDPSDRYISENMGLLGQLRGRSYTSCLRSQEAYPSMRCLDSRLSAIGRMPRPRKALRTIKIDPKLIREARELVGACNEKGSQADALTLLLADATPSKPCNNLNCHGWHLPEDCHLPAICTVCGENNQTACHCRMVCARCGAAGHNRMRCVAEKDTFGAPLSPLVGVHRRLTRQPDGLSVAPPADRQGRVRR